MPYSVLYNTFIRDEDDDAFDKDGLLRDGKRVHVNMQFMDHDRFMDCDRFMDDAAIARREFYDFQRAELSAQWKGGLQDGDIVRLGDRNLVVAGRNPETGKVRLADMSSTAVDADAIKQAAYAEYEQRLTRAWMRDEDPAPGDVCVSGPGLAGHWVRSKSGELVCAPDKVVSRPAPTATEPPPDEPDDEEWELAGPLSDSDEARAVKDRAYESYERDLVTAWQRR